MMIHFNFEGRLKDIKIWNGSFSIGLPPKGGKKNDVWFIGYFCFSKKHEENEFYQVSFDKDQETGVEELSVDDKNGRFISVNRGVRFVHGDFRTYGAQSITLDENEPAELVVKKVLEIVKCLRELKPFPIGIDIKNIDFE